LFVLAGRWALVRFNAVVLEDAVDLGLQLVNGFVG
jgi:hypothetical protein